VSLTIQHATRNVDKSIGLIVATNTFHLEFIIIISKVLWYLYQPLFF